MLKADPTDKRLYKCDGLGCKKRCADTMTADEWFKYCCHHTSDPSHAIDSKRSIRAVIFIEEEKHNEQE